MNTFGMVWFLLFFRSAPLTPPSQVAMRNHASITQGLGQDFRTLMANRNYKLILGSFSFVFFAYNAIGVNLALLFDPFNAGPFQDSILGVIFVTVGAISCFIAGILLDRTNKFITALRFVTAGAFCALVTAIGLCFT